LLTPETKNKIIDHLNENCKIMVDMNIELVSASYVSTMIKCCGDFIICSAYNNSNRGCISAHK
ncbi:MAG: hypothetical protein Q4B57_05945, partial [Eubacteriales bacterium]|nr:hypothetical protein [Eubacteriales bacterium]